MTNNNIEDNSTSMEQVEMANQSGAEKGIQLTEKSAEEVVQALKNSQEKFQSYFSSLKKEQRETMTDEHSQYLQKILRKGETGTYGKEMMDLIYDPANGKENDKINNFFEKDIKFLEGSPVMGDKTKLITKLFSETSVNGLPDELGKTGEEKIMNMLNLFKETGISSDFAKKLAYKIGDNRNIDLRQVIKDPKYQKVFENWRWTEEEEKQMSQVSKYTNQELKEQTEGISYDKPIEKGSADLPDIKEEKPEIVEEKKTEEIKSEKTDLWSDQKYGAVIDNFHQSVPLEEQKKFTELFDQNPEFKNFVRNGNLKENINKENFAKIGSLMKEKGMSESTINGFLSQIEEFNGVKVNSETSTVEKQEVPTEQTEKSLDPEQKKQEFLEKTINDLSYYDINDNSNSQNDMVRDSIQVSIDQAQDSNLGLDELQKQNLYRTVDLLRYPTDETLGKYQFNDEVDRKNVADLVRIKNPSLADKILQEGKLATNNKAEKTSFDAGQNGIDSTKEFDPIQGNVEIYMRNNGLKPDNCYVLPDGTWMVNGKNLGSRVFYDETGLQQVGVSYDDFVKYYNK